MPRMRTREWSAMVDLTKYNGCGLEIQKGITPCWYMDDVEAKEPVWRPKALTQGTCGKLEYPDWKYICVQCAQRQGLAW